MLTYANRLPGWSLRQTGPNVFDNIVDFKYIKFQPHPQYPNLAIAFIRGRNYDQTGSGRRLSFICQLRANAAVTVGIATWSCAEDLDDIPPPDGLAADEMWRRPSTVLRKQGASADAATLLNSRHSGLEMEFMSCPGSPGCSSFRIDWQLNVLKALRFDATRRLRKTFGKD